jgi:hypothetical protein
VSPSLLPCRVRVGAAERQAVSRHKTMPRFAVYCDSILVGLSELESGDPPMGVAFGRFIPAPAYSEIQPAIIAASEHDGVAPVLVVREVGGDELRSTGGVFIRDFGVGDDEIELTVPRCRSPLI